MQKVVTIFCLLVLLTGCSVSRKAGQISVSEQYSDGPAEVNRILAQSNITAKSFFIEKAEVSIISEGQKQSFLVTVKFEHPDKYLISLRSKTGLEAARIFISKDSIMANDRINQIFYTGSSSYLESGFGIDIRLLGLLFGDIIFPATGVDSNSECQNNQRLIDLNVFGKKVSYLVDCRKNKVITTRIIDGFGRSLLTIEFDSFLKSENAFHPSVITLNIPEKKMLVNIRLRKVDYNFNGKVEFIPGAKYERKALL